LYIGVQGSGVRELEGLGVRELEGLGVRGLEGGDDILRFVFHKIISALSYFRTSP